MKIKVQTIGKNLEKKSPASKFTKFIRLLSNLYILPIEYKNDFKTVKFTLISLRTFISFILISTPFVFLLIWWFVFHWDFISQYFEKSLHVYHLFDFVQMLMLTNNVIQPYLTFPFLLWICTFWATFPELSQVWNQKNMEHDKICWCKEAALKVQMSLCLIVHMSGFQLLTFQSL